MDLELLLINSADGDSSLHLASYWGETNAIREILKTERGMQLLNFPMRPLQTTPLRLACSVGRAESVQELLRYGPDIEFPDIKKQTPLFVAVTGNHVECCKLLLEAGANPNGNAGNFMTPVLVASSRGFASVLKLLLQYGAEVKGGYTHPLQAAAASGELDCFILQLLQGTDPVMIEEKPDQAVQTVLLRS